MLTKLQKKTMLFIGIIFCIVYCVYHGNLVSQFYNDPGNDGPGMLEMLTNYPYVYVCFKLFGEKFYNILENYPVLYVFLGMIYTTALLMGFIYIIFILRNKIVAAVTKKK